MNYALAPLEGVTNALYRGCWAEHFSAADRCFTPFLAPNENAGLNTKELNDVLPERNRGIVLVPQLLTNRSDYFLSAARKLQALGYREVNLNLGCPSGTVTAKGKGSGQLRDLPALRQFFEEIFTGAGELLISVKTRLGWSDPEEFLKLMELYNAYPFSELIIHPRVRQDFYRGTVRTEWFDRGLSLAKMPVCYNGDLFTVSDVAAFRETHPTVERLMLGRGLVTNPGLLGELRGEPPMTKAAFRVFHNDLYARYRKSLSGTKPVLQKMKELWSYWRGSFSGSEKPLKYLRKAQSLPEYEGAVDLLLSNCPLAEEKRFRP